MLTDDARRTTTNDDGRQPIAIGLLSDSGHLILHFHYRTYIAPSQQITASNFNKNTKKCSPLVLSAAIFSSSALFPFSSGIGGVTDLERETNTGALEYHNNKIQCIGGIRFCTFTIVLLVSKHGPKSVYIHVQVTSYTVVVFQCLKFGFRLSIRPM